jgi:hypothetical protein
VSSGGKFRGVGFPTPDNKEKVEEQGNYSMDRSKVVACPGRYNEVENKPRLQILTVVTLLACEGCGSSVWLPRESGLDLLAFVAPTSA